MLVASFYQQKVSNWSLVSRFSLLSSVTKHNCAVLFFLDFLEDVMKHTTFDAQNHKLFEKILA